MKRWKINEQQSDPCEQPPAPDRATLKAGLTYVFRRNGYRNGQVTILDRQPNVYESSFTSEVVTCQFNGGNERRIFCKYGAVDSHSGYGDRGGVAYEAAVYRHVLQPIKKFCVVGFYGTYKDPKTGQVWLILEYLDNAARLEESSDPAVMNRAARWIGQFHALNERRLSREPMRPIKRFDAEYYAGWVQRTSLLAGRLQRRFPWLVTLYERFNEAVDLLLAAPLTVIHGEYYSHNVLIRDGIIYPVDWESAAIAAGEIDLASLSDNWPDDYARQFALEYQRARWPKGAPKDFQRRLDAARLYLLFRGLGEGSVWTTPGRRRWCAQQLRSAAERLGLIAHPKKSLPTEDQSGEER